MIKWLGITLAFIIIIPSGIYMFTSFNQVDTYDSNSLKKQVKEEIIKDTSNFLQEGVEAYKNGEIDLAAEKFNEVLNEPEANYYMALIYKKRNLIQPAIDKLKKAIELNPNYIAAKKEYMFINLDNGDGGEARKYFDELFAKNQLTKEEILKIFNVIANEYYEDETCIQMAHKVITVDSRNETALAILLRDAINRGDEKAQIFVLEKLLAKEYDYTIANRLLGLYVKNQYFTKGLKLLDTIEAHGYNSYEIERARNALQQMKEEYLENK